MAGGGRRFSRSRAPWRPWVISRISSSPWASSCAGNTEDARDFFYVARHSLFAPRAPLPLGDIGGHFVNVSLVEFAPPLRRPWVISRISCSPWASVCAGNTGDARNVYFEFSTVFRGRRFWQVWSRLFCREFLVQNLGRLLVAHRFDAGGVRTGQTPLRAGHSNPC